jgi:hypothetical protein
MIIRKFCSLTVTLLLAASCIAVAAPATETHVWIFAGLPGDDEHHADFVKTLAALKATFTTQFGIPAEQLTLYYGPKDAGYAGPATRENILGACQQISAITHQSPQAQHWIVFIGHAHAIKGGAQLNLPGPDLNSIDLAKAFSTCAPAAALTFYFTHTASAPFLRPLAAPGRMIITATAPGNIENETEFPAALAEALEASGTDANKDGKIDVFEVFQATRERVLRRYKRESLIIREVALLDGDGDGRGTQRPAEQDAKPAATRSFTLTTSGKGIE